MEEQIVKSPDEIKVEELRSKLDRYNVSNCIATVNINSETEGLVDISHEQIKKASPEQLGEWAILLAKYAYFVQKLYNEEKTIAFWANANINKIIFRDFSQYKKAYATFEETKAAAILGNEVASLYERIRVNAEMKITQLDGLPQRIHAISNTLIENQKAKKQWMRNQ